MASSLSGARPKPRGPTGRRERARPHGLQGVQVDAVLRALGAGQAGLDRAHVQLQGVAEVGVGRVVGAEEHVLAHVAGDELHLLLAAAGADEEAQRLFVHREEAHGGAVLGRHVGDRGAVRQRQLAEAGAVELDELVHHALLAQHLGDAQHQVGGGGAFGERAGQLEADDLRHEHVDGLAEHDGFGLDAADAPAHHAEAVDHRRVAVRAHQRVGEGDRLSVPIARTQHDDLRQVLQVHLVDDAGGRRHDAEVVERLLPPLEKLVALAVALELALGVVEQREHAAELVHLHRVVDDEVDRDEGIHLPGVAAQPCHGVAQRGQIDDAGHAGEVLQDHPRGLERDLDLAGGLRTPVGDGLDGLLGNLEAVGLA